MKKLVLLVILGLLVSCNDSSKRDQVDRGSTKVKGSFGSDIFYVSDPRTGFCFAVTDPRTQFATTTAVDCTPKVIQAIQEDRP
jgi:hypothetical protein